MASSNSAASPSESHEAAYVAICREAARNDLMFDVFRRHPVYMDVVETLGPDHGLDYMRMALEKSPDFAQRIEDFRINDAFGAPLLASYGPIGEFSPTTLRYIKVASDLLHSFGSLDGQRIAEIGVGYGGRCRILSVLHCFAAYDLYDLPEALELAMRYLDALDVMQVSPANTDQPAAPYDLVISNYAFSEFRREVSLATPATKPKGGQFALYAKALHGNPYDGHTLAPVIAEMTQQNGVEPRRIHLDKGYRGHNYPRFRVWISGQVRRVTAAIRREMKRRAAIEPVIGHVKAKHRMGHNYLKGRAGDKANAVLAAAGFNFSLLLRWFEAILRALWPAIIRATPAHA